MYDFHQAPHIYPGKVCINVTNLERSHQFYTDIIGLKILTEQSNTITYTADGIKPLLKIVQPEGIVNKEEGTTGLYHFALLLPNRTELGRMLIHLLQKKAQLGAADHAVSEALYLSDPDGNGIEIYADRNPSEWQWTDGKVVMTTEELKGKELLAEGAGRILRKLPTNTIMGHIHLHVDNLISAMKFYLDLGFEIVSQYPQALFLANGKYHHHIAINTWNGTGAPPPGKQQAGLAYFTLIYPDQTTIHQLLEKLDTTVEYLGDDVMIQDPAGNHVVLSTDHIK